MTAVATRVKMGRKPTFQKAVKKFTKDAQKRLVDNPAYREGLRFQRFEASNYSSQESAAERARAGRRLAAENGAYLDFYTKFDPIMGRWYVWFRLDPEPR